MAKFCRECGKELRDGAQFCGGCGSRTVSDNPPASSGGVGTIPRVAPAPQPQAGVRQASAPPPPPGTIPTIPAAPSMPKQGEIPQAFAQVAAQGEDSVSGLPLKGREYAALIHKSVPPTSQVGKILDLSIRATFLDPDVYSQAVKDQQQTTEAAIVAAVSIFCASAGPALLSMLTGNINLGWMIGLLLVQVAGFAAFVFGASLAAPSVAGIKVDPVALFRSVAWAQAVGVLGILPVVGSLISLWRIPTTVVSVRDGLKIDITKAIILCVIGAVCGAIASTLVSTIVFGLIGGARGFLP